MERVMTRLPATITPDTTLSEARDAMSRYRIRHLPVVENGRPVSMVCERDLSIAETIFKETKQARAAHVVRLLGNVKVHRVALDAPLASVLDEMCGERLDAVLVVDGDRLVGIFTATDACRILASGLTRPA
jgi:CBS domain-containing protein